MIDNLLASVLCLGACVGRVRCNDTFGYLDSNICIVLIVPVLHRVKAFLDLIKIITGAQLCYTYVI